MKPIRPLDAAWRYVDTRETPMQVGCLAIFSLPPKAGPAFLAMLVEQFRAARQFAEPFNLRLKSPRLRYLLPAWEEADDIDLEYRFRHSALPQPGGERGFTGCRKTLPSMQRLSVYAGEALGELERRLSA